ncbi:ferrochelatase [Metabacillus fastidiosus]|uniref:ferrochelatase n=1 Tax=Metabacillus fastidiosus TaxID=1458 RepID=UPI003D2B202E
MIGVIIFAYGAPSSIDDLEEYYTNIRYGKIPSVEDMEAAKERFRQTGTADLLGAVTERQAQALSHSLQHIFIEKVKVYTAYKHTPSFVEDTVEKMVQEGVTYVITLPLNPLYSKTGTGLYQRKVHKALEKMGISIPVLDINHWHTHPELVTVIANRLEIAVNWLPGNVHNETAVIFTAHSQPGKPETHKIYSEQFLELAQSIAKKLQLKTWKIAYRSAGSHGELWSGPDIKEVIRDEAGKGRRGIVTCDLLSLTANIEVLYDIGYDCQKLCKELGLEFNRAELLNDSYDFIIALTNIVKERAFSCDLFQNCLIK